MNFSSLELSHVLGAAIVGLISVSSLFGGAHVGFAYKPPERVSAIIMAFGTGALIQALVLDLAYQGAQRLIHQGHLSGWASWLWVAGGFVAGGGMYYVGNRFLEARGAAMRHPALAKLYVQRKRLQESELLLKKLSRIDIVRTLPPEDVEDVLVAVHLVRKPKGHVIFQKGDRGDALYLVDEGLVDILQNPVDAAGENPRIAQLGSGHSFGEMALLSGENRMATAVAATDVVLLRIDKVHFDELMERSRSLRRAIEALNSFRLLTNVESTSGTASQMEWQKAAVSNLRRLSQDDRQSLIRQHAIQGTGLALFFGTMLDTIPESIVIGSSWSGLHDFRFTFLVSVFIANIPEAMASAAAMRAAGYSRERVLSLWAGLCICGIAASVVGNMMFASAPPAVLTLVGAVAGGSILAMVSSVMMPEAYEDGGPSVGLATITGFLTAFLFSLV